MADRGRAAPRRSDRLCRRQRRPHGAARFRQPAAAPFRHPRWPDRRAGLGLYPRGALGGTQSQTHLRDDRRPHPPRCHRQRSRRRLRIQHRRPGGAIGACGRHRPAVARRGAAVAGGALQPCNPGFPAAQRPLSPARRLDGGADPRTPSSDPVGRPARCRGWPPTVRSGLGLRPSRGRRDRSQLSGGAVALGDRRGLGRRDRRGRGHARYTPAVPDRTGHLQPTTRRPLRRPFHPRRRRHRPARADRA